MTSITGNHPQSCQSPLDGTSAPVRIACAAVLIIAVVLLERWTSLMLALVASLALAIAARCSARSIRHRLAHVEGFLIVLLVLLPFTIAGTPVITIGPFAASAEGLHRAFVIMLKVNTAALILLALVSGIEPIRIGKALTRLGLPDTLALLLLLSMRYVAVFRSESVRLSEAMRARGFNPRSNMHTWRTLGNLLGQMLVRSIERAERVEQAMRVRGFAGRLPQEEAEQVTRADLWLCAGTFVILSALAASRWI